MTHMDDKTNQAPEQSGMPDNEEYSSYTLPTEDAAAQEAHTIPLEDAAAQESRTIPLEDERTQGAPRSPQRKNLRCRGSSAAQPL